VLRSLILGADSPLVSQIMYLHLITTASWQANERASEHYPNAVVLPTAWFRSMDCFCSHSFPAFDVCMRCRACLPCEMGCDGMRCESAQRVCVRASERVSAVCEQRLLAFFPSFCGPCLHICNSMHVKRVARVAI
jgi:hypothetical protein